MKYTNLIVWTLILTLFLLSCKKSPGENVVIRDDINTGYEFPIEQYPIEGLETDYILFGGSGHYAIPPECILGNTVFYLTGGNSYKNEFYIVTKKLKQSGMLLTNSFYLGTRYTPFVEGMKVTFVWNTKFQFEGWYHYFVNNGIIDPIRSGDTVQVMRIAENISQYDISYTNQMKSKVVVLKYNEDSGQFETIKSGSYKPIEIEAKGKVGIVESFLYSGSDKYQVNYEIEKADEKIREYSIESNNLGQ